MSVSVDKSRETGLIGEVDYLCSAGRGSWNCSDLVVLNFEEDISSRLVGLAVNQCPAMDENGRRLRSGRSSGLSRCNRCNIRSNKDGNNSSKYQSHDASEFSAGIINQPSRNS